MRTIIVLSVALAVSLLTNVVCVYRLGHGAAASAAALTEAKMAGAIEALSERADQVNHVALAADRDGRQLQADLRAADRAAADRLRSYQDFLRDLPPLPAGCGPGRARVDALNRLTGATP